MSDSKIKTLIPPSERQLAIKAAQRILERPHQDPDSDLAMLARQFLRAEEDRTRIDFIESQLLNDGGAIVDAETGRPSPVRTWIVATTDMKFRLREAIDHLTKGIRASAS